MDAEDTAELQSLRARAYGPEADIHDDPAALRRLAELEERNLPADPEPRGHDGRLPGADIGRQGGEPGPADRVDAEPVEPPKEGEADAERAAGPPQSERRRRLWIPAAWVASLLVVAALVGAWTVTTTLAVFSPIQRDGIGRQVAVLEIDPDFESPPIFGQGEVGQIGFHDFHGLTAIATNASWMGGPADGDGRCLFVMRTDAIDVEAESFNGPIFNDCTAGSFPAAVELPVTGNLPAEIRERFPDGVALQFVLDGDRVGVFTDAE